MNKKEGRKSDVRVQLVPITSDGKVLELSSLYVEEEHRHKGLGAQAVRKAIETARQTGARKIQVHVPAEYEHWWVGLGFRTKAKELHMEVEFYDEAS